MSLLFNPEDKTWLISSYTDLQDDADQNLGYYKKWDPPQEAKHYGGRDRVERAVTMSSYPGYLAPLDAKVEWMKRLHLAREKDVQDDYMYLETSTRPQVSDLAAAAMYVACPEDVAILFKVSRDDLQDLNLDENSAEHAYDEGVSYLGDGKYFNDDNNDECVTGTKRDWKGYRDWLLKSTPDEDDYVKIAAFDAPKDFLLHLQVADLVTRFGLERHFLDYTVESVNFGDDTGSDNNEGRHKFERQHLVGENVCTKTREYDKERFQNVEADVALEVVLRLNSNPGGGAITDWEMSLDKAARKTGEGSYGSLVARTYELVPKADKKESPDTVARSPENFNVLWLWKAYYDQEYGRIRDHFFHGRGECKTIRDRLKHSTMNAGACRVSVFEQEMTYLTKCVGGKGRNVDWNHRSHCALALTRVVVENAEEYGWFANNGYPEDLKNIVKDLATYWRMTLLKKTDSQLGIYPPEFLSPNDVPSSGVDGMSSSRAALYEVLEGLSVRYENLGIQLNWRPGKRKALAKTDGSNPTKKVKKPATILKDSTKKYSPSGDYAEFTQDAASALLSWIERNQTLESDAKKRCWQIRCTSEEPYNNERLRVLVVTGATPIFALTKFVSEAFGWRPHDKRFDPTMTKGVVPPGSFWTVERHEGEETKRAGIIGTQSAAYKAAGKGAPFFDDKKVKVFQLLRRRGDTLVYRCDRDRKVTIRLDGMESKPDYYKGRYTPICVGADDWSLTKQAWSNLNARFLANKPAEMVLTSSALTEEERQDAVNNRYKIPLFDNKGASIDRENSGFDGVAEMHRIVSQPFVE